MCQAADTHAELDNWFPTATAGCDARTETCVGSLGAARQRTEHGREFLTRVAQESGVRTEQKIYMLPAAALEPLKYCATRPVLLTKEGAMNITRHSQPQACYGHVREEGYIYRYLA